MYRSTELKTQVSIYNRHLCTKTQIKFKNNTNTYKQNTKQTKQKQYVGEGKLKGQSQNP